MIRKASEKAAKAAKKLADEKAKAQKEAAEKAKKELAEKDGKTDAEKDEEKKEEEEKPAEMEVEEVVEEEPEFDFDGLDVFAVEEVDDIGQGIPLYKDFTPDDWALVSLAFELHLLAHAFKKDCNDEERLGVHLDHLAFYYNKYYKKNLVNKDYGVESNHELLALVKESVTANSSNVLETYLDEEMEYPQVFVKIAEEARRYRSLLIDVGEESAKLKIRASASHQERQNRPPKGAGKGPGPMPFAKGASKGPSGQFQVGHKGAPKGAAIDFQAPNKGGFQGDKGAGKGPSKGFDAKGYDAKGYGKAGGKDKGGYGKATPQQWGPPFAGKDGKGGKGKGYEPYPTHGGNKGGKGGKPSWKGGK